MSLSPKVRKYGAFSGVDFTNTTPEMFRCPYLRNMYKDYTNENGIALETRAGFRMLQYFAPETGETVNKIHFFSNPERKAINLEIPVEGGLTYYLKNEDNGKIVNVTSLAETGTIELMAPKYDINDDNSEINGNDIYIIVNLLGSAITLKMIKDNAVTTVSGDYEYIIDNLPVSRVYGLNTNLANKTLPIMPIYVQFEEDKAFTEDGAYVLTNKNVYLFKDNTFTKINDSAINNAHFFSFKADEYVIDSTNGIYRLDFNTINPINFYIPTYAIVDTDGTTDGVYQQLNALTNAYYIEFNHNSSDTDDGTYAYTIIQAYGINVKIEVTQVLYNGAVVDEEDYTVTETLLNQEYSYTIKFNASISFEAGDIMSVKVEYADEIVNRYNPINDCTITEIYKDRVFFSGNAKEPNVYYWSADNDPTYVPIVNYREAGLASNPIAALLAIEDVLYILKSNNAEESPLYQGYEYVTELEELPEDYPNKPLRAGYGCLSGVVRFNNEPLFISQEGLKAIDRKSSYSEESDIEHRSTLIDGKFLKSTLTDVKFTTWRGYLVMLINDGTIYLADSRQRYKSDKGYYEYEWFLWNDIGLYAGATDIAVYDDEEETVLRHTYRDTDGTFYPAMAIAENNNELYFCASNGTNIYMCKFNTDILRSDGRLQEIAYADGGAIIYDFDIELGEHYWLPELLTSKPYYGRPILNGFSTIRDYCGTYSLTKTLNKKGFAMLMKTFVRSGCKVRFKVGGDTLWQEMSDMISTSAFEFETVDFADTTFIVDERVIIRLKKKVKKFDDISFLVYNDTINKPFGIYEMQAEIFYGGYGK